MLYGFHYNAQFSTSSAEAQSLSGIRMNNTLAVPAAAINEQLTRVALTSLFDIPPNGQSVVMTFWKMITRCTSLLASMFALRTEFLNESSMSNEVSPKGAGAYRVLLHQRW